MKRRNKIGLLFMGICLVLLIMGATAFGEGEPNNVGEILKFNKLDWIVGEWMGLTDANEKAEAKFDLVMDGYVLSIKARVGRYEFTGLAYYVASSNTIVAAGADNRGRTFGGSWLIDGDKLLLKIEQTGRDGTVNHFDRYLSMADANTMRSVTYTVVDGKRAEQPMGILEFKRKK
jgi:hypothetical protein